MAEHEPDPAHLDPAHLEPDHLRPAHLEPDHLDPEQYDRLVLISLGEDVGPDPDFDAHRAGCEWCRAELERLTRVVGLGRETGPLRDGGAAGPRPEVWDTVAQELDLRDQSPAPAPVPAPSPASVDAGAARWIRPRTVVAGAVAAVVLAAAVLVGVAIGSRGPDAPSARIRVEATLQPIDAGPTGSGGRARVVETDGRMHLIVDTHGLPQRGGYYEVWLYDPRSRRMVPVGMLGAGARGEFLMPGDIDLITFNVVDVSAQDYDGNPAHKNSVLRGGLRS